MTRTQLRSMARAYVPGARNTVVTDTTMNDIFDLATIDICSYGRLIPANVKIDVVADQYEYNIANNATGFLCMDRSGLYWNEGSESATDWKQLYPRTIKWLDEEKPAWRDEDSSDPEYYWVEGNSFFVHPTPDTALTDGFWLYYIKKPTLMTSDDHYPFSGSTTEWPSFSIFDDVILAYCVWKSCDILNKTTEAAAAKLLYEQLRNEKIVLFRRSLDISYSPDTKFRGRMIR